MAIQTSYVGRRDVNVRTCLIFLEYEAGMQLQVINV